MSLCDAPHGTQRAELVLSGLSCPACVRTVEEALRGVPGVESASVNLATAHAFVDYDPSRTSLVAIHDAIKKAGYRVDLGRARFRIKGMTCASCVTRIEGALKATPGVIGGTVSVGTEEAEVEYDLGATNLHSVKAAVASAGYRVIEGPPPSSPSAIDQEASAREREYRTLMRQWWFGAAVGSFTMIMSYPWLFPGLGTLFPRDSHRLWYMWAGMGIAALAVLLHRGLRPWRKRWRRRLRPSRPRRPTGVRGSSSEAHAIPGLVKPARGVMRKGGVVTVYAV